MIGHNRLSSPVPFSIMVRLSPSTFFVNAAGPRRRWIVIPAHSAVTWVNVGAQRRPSERDSNYQTQFAWGHYSCPASGWSDSQRLAVGAHFLARQTRMGPGPRWTSLY